MNWVIIIVIALLLTGLILSLLNSNTSDKNKFEKQLNNDFIGDALKNTGKHHNENIK